jgi:alpha-N-arabinofuranosidase
MANIAQMVNVLQAMILTDGPRMTLTADRITPSRCTIPFQGATYLPTEIRTPQYSLGKVTVPSVVSVTAARRHGGKTPGRPRQSRSEARGHRLARQSAGAKASGASGACSPPHSMDAHNTFEAPQTVKPRPSARKAFG